MADPKDQIHVDAFAVLRRDCDAERSLHANARPPNLDLKPMGSYAEDFPEEHRRIGERNGYQDVEAEVRVTHDDGTQVVEVWRGISRRHALLKARAHYREVARADFANGEPY